MATQLNPKQSAAVRLIDRPLLVLAGAGSGKTSVITQKIAYLVLECGLRAHNIVAVTFTNKAAREMNERVRKLINGKKARGLTISTFHNLGLTIIRKDLKAFGFKPGFTIFDAADSKALISELTFKDKNIEDEADDFNQRQISTWKNDLITPQRAQSFAKDAKELLAATVYENYNRTLKSYNCLLYTSDAADELTRVDLCGCGVLQKQNTIHTSIHRR